VKCHEIRNVFNFFVTQYINSYVLDTLYGGLLEGLLFGLAPSIAADGYKKRALNLL